MDSLMAFLMEVLQAVSGWKGMPVQFVLAGVVALLVSSLKVDLLRKYLWDRLGSYKVLLAPALSLLGAVLMVQPFTWATFWASLTTGAGAIALYELFKAAKALPGLSPLVSKILDLISGLFKSK
jgi:hypothetical protein